MYGTPYSGGFAQVDNGGFAGGSGLDLAVNNINLAFDFGAPLPRGLSLYFGEYGGNVNLEVNGDFVNVDNFDDVHGATIGGVRVTAVGGGNETGRLFLSGAVHAFSIGGQELWIDNVCPETFPERVRLPVIMRDAPST